MELAGLRSATRTMLDDHKQPYLWPDEDIDRRLNNAVREACLRARLLRDSADTNPKLCVIPVKAGQDVVRLHPSILVPRSGILAGFPHKVYALSGPSMDKLRPGWDNGTHSAAAPCFMIMDTAQKLVQLWPKPDADYTLRLRVWRLPTDEEAMEGDSDEPVIILPDPEELCHWAAYECYMVQDSETLNPQAASRHLGLFESRFGSRPTLHDMARWADSPPRIRHAHMF